jgi:acyl-CoA synthetase (NDP forming)
VFNPKTIAVVGEKRESDFLFLHNMDHFKGKVYSVQIDPQEIREIEALGYENYKSLLDIPEPVDYVVVAVPRAATPKIIADCIEKQVGGVALFTAGFAETGSEDGIRLQNILQKMAKESGLNLIGPN